MSECVCVCVSLCVCVWRIHMCVWRVGVKHNMIVYLLGYTRKSPSLSLKGLAKAEVLSYIVPGMQVATD